MVTSYTAPSTKVDGGSGAAGKLTAAEANALTGATQSLCADVATFATKASPTFTGTVTVANLAATGTVTVPAPTLSGHAAPKSYVDTAVAALGVDSLPLAVPATIVWTGSAWPARTTATAQSNRRVIWIGNSGGTGPTDAQPNDLWTQG